MAFTGELTLDSPDLTVSGVTEAVCSSCGERLEVVDDRWQHTARALAGRKRDHRPYPTDPDKIPAAKGIAHLRAIIDELEATDDPAVRDRIAVELAAMGPRVAQQVRREAAEKAITMMRAATYARLIGVSRQAVDKLLARR